VLWELSVSLSVLSERVQHAASVKVGVSQMCTRLLRHGLSDDQEMSMEVCQ
jgi:hypothetical protein